MEPTRMSIPAHAPLMKRLAMLVASVLVVSLILSFAGCGGGGTAAPQGEGSTTPQGGGAAPTPGASFSGPVEISGTASSAIISLVVSADGASITSVGVTLNDLKTESFSAGSMTKEVTGSIPIKDGSFSGSLSGLGEIDGRFASPTEASGTVKLNVEIPYSVPADLGEFSWNAKAQ